MNNALSNSDSHQITLFGKVPPPQSSAQTDKIQKIIKMDTT